MAPKQNMKGFPERQQATPPRARGVDRLHVRPPPRCRWNDEEEEQRGHEEDLPRTLEQDTFVPPEVRFAHGPWQSCTYEMSSMYHTSQHAQLLVRCSLCAEFLQVICRLKNSKSWLLGGSCCSAVSCRLNVHKTERIQRFAEAG